MADDLTTIEIDIDVYKTIESARNSFKESPNDVLRRLLGLQREPVPGVDPGNAPEPSGKAWTGRGVTLPHGTEIRMKYRSQHYTGRILDGKWVVGSVRASSPSGAARMLAVAAAGHHPSLNGWRYWEARTLGTPNWISIDTLRKKGRP